MRVRFDAGQRFTCSQCGRCCRRGWDIAVTAAEVEGYRRARAERWFREQEAITEGAATDPFEAVAESGHYRIRKRADGACGFLSAESRCRIHEELGGGKKPLSCRLFPFRVHPADGEAVITSSFCCPTIVANEGAPLASASRDLGSLARAWTRAWPEPARDRLFVEGRPMPPRALEALRCVLRQVLERPGPEGGPPDLARNVGGTGRLLEDLGRRRVLRLADDAFTEYLELTGGHAARSAEGPPVRPPSALGRLFARGFLFAVLAAREQLRAGRPAGLRLRLRGRLLRLLLHLHGLAPPAGGVDLGLARRVRLDPSEPDLHRLLSHYLRSSIEGLGTGGRPVTEDLAMAVAFLNAACTLSRLRAAEAERSSVERVDLVDGLMEASDLTHADTATGFGSLLRLFGSGVEPFYVFAAGGLP